MNDQAEKLRLRLQSQYENKKNATAIAVVSGKGGVGKSNFSLNFALSLVQTNQSVLVIDMDLGMGNLDILMGKTSQYNLADFITNNIPLSQIVMEANNGIHYIAGGTGLSQLVKFEENQLSHFTSELQGLIEQYDFLIFDMGAGISEETLNILLSSNEIIVVTTPEPTAMTDAYATMKVIHLNDALIPMHMVINRVTNDKEGEETFKRLSIVMSKFLNREVFSLGFIPDDKSINQAVKRQIPFLQFNHRSPASRALLVIRDRYQSNNSKQDVKISMPFVSKLKKFLFER